MARTHYHTLIGMLGLYMPDTNDYHATRADAVKGALWHIRMLRDEGARVRGNVRVGYWQTTDGRTSIEITRCTVADCRADE